MVPSVLLLQHEYSCHLMPRAREKIEPKFLPKAVCEPKQGTWLIIPLGSHILKRDIKEISLIVFENQLIKIRIESVDD